MNWWFVRLAMDGDGRVDPVRYNEVCYRSTFRTLVEMHIAQDFVDQLTEHEREKARREAQG